MSAPAYFPPDSALEVDARTDRTRGYVIVLDPEAAEMEARLRAGARWAEALFNLLLIGTCFAVIGAEEVAAVTMLVIAVPVFVGTLIYSHWRRIPVWITAILLLAPAVSLAVLIGACIAIVVVAYG